MELIDAPKELEEIAEELEIQYSEFYGVSKEKFIAEINYERNDSSYFSYFILTDSSLTISVSEKCKTLEETFKHEYRHAIHLMIQKYVVRDNLEGYIQYLKDRTTTHHSDEFDSVESKLELFNLMDEIKSYGSEGAILTYSNLFSEADKLIYDETFANDGNDEDRIKTINKKFFFISSILNSAHLTMGYGLGTVIGALSTLFFPEVNGEDLHYFSFGGIGVAMATLPFVMKYINLDPFEIIDKDKCFSMENLEKFPKSDRKYLVSMPPYFPEDDFGEHLLKLKNIGLPIEYQPDSTD